MKYDPKFLNWCTSYEHEVRDFRNLIESCPADEKQLKKEYQQLTGKMFRLSLLKICSECRESFAAHWLKDGKCNGCRNPHLIVGAVV